MGNGEVIINRRNFVKLGTAIVGGAAVYKLFKNDIDRVLYNLLYGEPQPRTMPAGNASIKETPRPTETPQPSYDYYDEEFKVGIMIEGSPSEKKNITNLIETWKKITPDDYKDNFPYAPKRMFVSNDGFNAYGGSDNNDYIRLDRTNEIRGGSDDLKTRIVGVVDMEPEFGNAKRSKTGIKFSSGYESELDVAIRKAKYAARVGVWTQAQADAYVENISKRINPDGSYKN